MGSRLLHRSGLCRSISSEESAWQADGRYGCGDRLGHEQGQHHEGGVEPGRAYVQCSDERARLWLRLVRPDPGCDGRKDGYDLERDLQAPDGHTANAVAWSERSRSVLLVYLRRHGDRPDDGKGDGI